MTAAPHDSTRSAQTRRPRRLSLGYASSITSIRPLILACAAFVASSAYAADYPAPVEADFILRDFRFANGETLPEQHRVGRERRAGRAVVAYIGHRYAMSQSRACGLSVETLRERTLAQAAARPRLGYRRICCAATGSS